MQFWIWSEAQGAACGLSYSGWNVVGGYPPIRGVKKLDLPRSYVPRAVLIPALFYSCATHHDAILYLVGSTMHSLGAELFREYLRRGVPPNSRGEEIGPA